MERLTKRLEDGQAVFHGCHGTCGTCDGANCYCVGPMVDRLAAYEDTGLEPEEIYEVRFLIAAQRDPQKLSRLSDLVLADKEGRLVVLPCKTKETVYVVGEKRIIECFIAEVYIDDARGLEYMVSFDCDNDCDGCPFNSWRQDYSGEYSCDGEYGDGCILGSAFGKTVFLTRKEAEAALAAKGGEG